MIPKKKREAVNACNGWLVAAGSKPSSYSDFLAKEMCKNKLAARIHFSHDTANKHLSGVAQMSQYSSPELCKLINRAHCTLVA